MITVTEKAAKKALSLAERDKRAAILRLGVRGGGCVGLTYFYEFDDKQRPDDHVWDVAGLTVVCDPKSMKILEGTVLDYDTNLLKGGFRFNNPQAKRACSCGESFTL
ncbi:MAG TPA: iron-sulfur cluster assembly accessory protein [Myxococcota bacterium]|nr:iron-sulfur cluster assembly accessory protein [Myxococcota bacterium]